MTLIRKEGSNNESPSPPPSYQSYLVTASISDLNLRSSYVQSKMDFERGLISPNGIEARLDDAARTTSRSIDIPVPSTPPSHPRMAEKKYWKLSFRIVLIPLILLGIPAHLPLMKRRIKTKEDWIKSHVECGNVGPTERRVGTRQDFLKSCGNIGIVILSFVIFLYSLGLNVYVLRNIVEMFVILIIKGDLNPSVMLNLVNLVQDLPIIIPMNFIWIWGYVLRDLILSFSRPSLSDSFLLNPDLFLGNQPKLPGRGKLIGMYILIAFIHTIHIYMYSARATENLPDALSVVTHFGNYFIGPVFSTLVLPVYATFCWACHRHYTILTNYIQSLISMRATPDVAYFNRFKLAFKELSDRVQLLNRLFSIYFSWVILNVLMSLYVEASDLIDIFFSSMKTPDTPGVQPNQAPLLPPEVVRAAVGFVFIVFLKVMLLAFTFWQAVGVNDMARSLNIWLNDLVTEPNANVNQSNYHAFRLLKFYVRSRMQQPRPALLRIPILGCIPVLKYRLNPPTLDQY